MGRRGQPRVDALAVTAAVPQLCHAAGTEIKKEMTAINDIERAREVKRNIRRTATVLWLIVAAIFFYMLAKYYWIAR